MDYGKAHAEADKALNDSSYKMGGLSPLLSEIANPNKARLIFYDGFLLLNNNAFNLRNITTIKLEEVFADINYGVKSKHVHVGYDIVFEFEKNHISHYKHYRLSPEVIDKLTKYLHSSSSQYQIDVEQITLEPLQQLKAVANYEFTTLMNTIQR